MKPGSLRQRLEESLGAVRKITSWTPEVAIILGTGLGNLARRIKTEVEVTYSGIPHFPRVTVESHAGKLVLGTLSGKKVAALEGRFHAYEGYSMEEVTFPVRLIHELGAKILVVSNAAGGINLNYKKGDLVLIEDHINLMGVNPLIGPNDDRLGPRFPDLSQPYSKRLIQLTEAAAGALKLQVRRGVYLAVTGPNLETRAEYRMIQRLGADLVGMSTVPEVLAGVHMGMEILGVSVVTDVCDPDHLEPVDIKEIIATANEAGPKLDRLIEAALQKF
ncbi:MAG: purine-nucleoside phosphorylase [Candidatus Omnitrophica bacterium]|nr:purine-nucleoside phosphorylase [Candidatus Omnitrophota bacterium]